MIDNLFMKFAAFYGQQFLAKWQGIDIKMVKNEWEDALSVFHEKSILIALNNCRENNPYPPSLPEFIQLCKQFRFTEQKALPQKPPKFNPDNMTKIQEIKEMLRKKMVVSDEL